MMKKSKWTLFLLIILGLLGGSLVGYWLEAVPGLSFLTHSLTTTWSPAFNLHVISFNMSLHINISLLSILGMILAIWLYRKV